MTYGYLWIREYLLCFDDRRKRVSKDRPVAPTATDEPNGKTIDASRLAVVLAANGLLRIANSSNGALIGFYLAHLALQGHPANAAMLGALGVVFSAFELSGAVPVGMLADRFPLRNILVLGALVAAAATQLFGITGLVAIFYLSRALEGLSAASSAPTLLAHIADATGRVPQSRGRWMGFFEISLLSGIALGGLVGVTLWDTFHTYAFSTVAVVYLVVAALFFWGAQARGNSLTPAVGPLAGLTRVFADPLLKRLAPAWLAVNAIIGLWLTHIGFQLSGPKAAGQYLVGRFSATQVGLILLGFAIAFSVGVVAWGFILTSVTRVYALRGTMVGIFFACLWLYLLNASTDWNTSWRLGILSFLALSVMVASGFTPTALAFLADVAGNVEGRGTAMGVYTLLFGLGNALGAGLGGALAHIFAFNGLIIGTVVLAFVSLAALALLPTK
jgi:MFS family permease